jgi:hypothetical protein
LNLTAPLVTVELTGTTMLFALVSPDAHVNVPDFDV